VAIGHVLPLLHDRILRAGADFIVERVDVQEDTLEVRIRAEGLASLVAELRQQGKRKAA
jgi:hypothetical protein